MSDAVVANNMVFPNLGAAVEVLVNQGGAEQFEYTPTVMGALETPTQAQVMGAIEGMLQQLNPESPVNDILYRQISDECQYAAAVLATAVLKEAKARPTNVSREGTLVWKLAVKETQAPDLDAVDDALAAIVPIQKEPAEGKDATTVPDLMQALEDSVSTARQVRKAAKAEPSAEGPKADAE